MSVKNPKKKKIDFSESLLNPEILIQAYRTMLLIRHFEYAHRYDKKHYPRAV